MKTLGPFSLLAGLFALVVPGLVRAGDPGTPDGAPASLEGFLEFHPVLDDDAGRFNPPPPEPPAFGRGHRPEPWTVWEVPIPLRRFSLNAYVGYVNLLPKSVALEMDNPDLVLASAEEVEVQSLWDTNAIAFSLQAGISLVPMVSFVFEGSLFTFNREVSPPTLYVVYEDATHYQQLLSAGDLRVFQLALCAVFHFPVDQVLFDAPNLVRLGNPEGRSGFVPFVIAGSGISILEEVEATVCRNEGGAFTTTKRPLYHRAFNPFLLLGLGLEYRLSLLGFAIRFEFGYNGEPLPAWSPYADASDSLLTYKIQLGIGVSF